MKDNEGLIAKLIIKMLEDMQRLKITTGGQLFAFFI